MKLPCTYRALRLIEALTLHFKDKCTLETPLFVSFVLTKQTAYEREAIIHVAFVCFCLRLQICELSENFNLQQFSISLTSVHMVLIFHCFIWQWYNSIFTLLNEFQRRNVLNVLPTKEAKQKLCKEITRHVRTEIQLSWPPSSKPHS